ncbi:hypothetical protein RRG08_055411 [Elysia crispata]|uniref:Uncharacterized protein n=1 Tax=Elysia crispata TaxID=231223 RepID=A0AAE1E2L9_9GAST|nr:hypothetical protein RRG08_055411 [Elysia crispata]
MESMELNRVYTLYSSAVKRLLPAPGPRGRTDSLVTPLLSELSQLTSIVQSNTSWNTISVLVVHEFLSETENVGYVGGERGHEVTPMTISHIVRTVYSVNCGWRQNLIT